MTRDETKRYLEGYLINMARAQQLKRKLEVYSMSAPSIEKEIDCYVNESGRIERHISSCEDMLAREIITRKYIYGQSLEMIAEALSYSVRQIQRILNTAVEKLGAKIK